MEKKRRILILFILFCSVLTLVCLALWLKDRDNGLTLYGNVDIRTVNISFRVGGRLASLTVDEGDAVESGQIMGELDNAPYRNALLQAKANVAAKKAQLDLALAGYRDEEIAQVRADLARQESAYRYAKSFYERQQSLKGSRAVSLDDVENARSAMNQALAALQAAKDKMRQYETGSRQEDKEAARAQYMQAEAALAQAELDLEDTVLRAPSPGTVLTRAVEPGTMLAAGNTVFTLSLTRPVWVRAYVDEVNLSRAVPGATVTLFIDGRPNQPYVGTIGFVSPTSEFTPKTVQTPELRTDLVYRLRIIVTDPDDTLRQGMPVTITFAP